MEFANYYIDGAWNRLSAASRSAGSSHLPSSSRRSAQEGFRHDEGCRRLAEVQGVVSLRRSSKAGASPHPPRISSTPSRQPCGRTVLLGIRSVSDR